MLITTNFSHLLFCFLNEQKELVLSRGANPINFSTHGMIYEHILKSEKMLYSSMGETKKMGNARYESSSGLNFYKTFC